MNYVQSQLRHLGIALFSILIIFALAALPDIPQTKASAAQCPLIAVGPGSIPGASLGVAYSQTFTASGGNAPYTFSRIAGSLPPGLFLNSGGRLAGTPNTLGNYNFTIQATGVNGCTGSRSYSMLVVCPNITLNPGTLPAATLGETYSQTLTASGGKSPYSFSRTTGSLPPGLFLNSGGGLSGTPNTTGTYNFTIRATDDNGCTGSRAYAVTVNCPNFLIFPANIPGATVGVSYSQNFSTTGGQSPYAYSLAGGSIPPGMFLGSGGVLGGTPNTSGTYNFTLRSTDANNCVDTRSYTLNVSCPTITLNPASLLNGKVGDLYLNIITATGGQGPYEYFIFIGSLPPGLTLSSTGVLGGTPTTAGNYSFTIRARDANNCFGLRAYTINIDPDCPTFTFSPATLPDATPGRVYVQTINVNSAASPYTLSLFSGSLPPGLNFDSATRTITGTAAPASGSFTFTLRATDANGCTGQRTYTIQMACATINIATDNVNATVGDSFLQTIFANGATSPYTFSFVAPNPPSWLNLSTTGVLTGTPAATGSFSFGVKATDAYGCSQTKTITLNAICPTITINPATLPAGTVGAAYSQVLSATGGTSPYSFGTNISALPPGLTLNTNGTLSGTPTTPGNYDFIIRGNDANGCFGERSYTLIVNNPVCPTITVNPATLPNGNTGAAYNQTLSATGGLAPYSFSSQTTALPPGLTLATNGNLSGTPTIVGSYNFTVRSTDANGCRGERNYTIAINNTVCPTITINPQALGTFRVGNVFGMNLTASGGTFPYTFSVLTGALPSGVILQPGGNLTGNPTTAGNYNFTVQATDANGCTGTRDYTMAVNNDTCPTITVNPSSFPAGTIGAVYNQNFSASGGSAPYTFSVFAGALPPGLSLTTSGALTGTPTTIGSYVFQVGATDTNGCTGSRAYTLVINNPVCPTITVNPTNSTLPSATVGAAYSQSFTGSGGVSPYKFSGNGNVPPGLNPTANGDLSGTPTAPGSYTFTVIAEDANGCTGERSYTLVVNSSVCPTININQTALPPGIVGTVYTQTLTATGGSSPYSYAISAGSLPVELVLNPTNGAILGAPAMAGVFNFTVRVTDINGCNGERSFTLVVSANLVTSVSAASFIAGDTLAPESIVATFGANLASSIQVTTTTVLPTELDGVSMKIKDSAGVERPAPLFFISPNQINHQMPAGTALGTAVVTVLNGANVVATGSVEITNVSPGLFSADASGRGLASAVVLRVRQNGLQSFEPVARFDTALGKFVAEPIDVANPADQVFLVFYGTGWKNRMSLAAVNCTIGGASSEVLYAGEVPGFVGYDQMNVRLSPSLAGMGEADAVITIDGKTANTVRIAIR